jgi:hypothetical protein
MRRAGCEALNFGLESAADPVLSLMGKRFTAAQASEVLRRTREAGIDAGINLVVGFPGETDADREDTARFVEDNAAVVRSVQLVNPALLTYGSPLWGLRDRFEFYDPRRPVTSWIDGGNTPWTRRAWTADLIARCERAGVPVGERNFLDDLDATPQRLAEGPLGGGVTWAFVGGRIFLSQGKRMLSAGEGLFLDWDDEGGRRFGYDLDWADEGGVPTARGGPIRWRMARSTQGGALTIVLSAACDAPARLERIKVSMVLDEAYRRWRFAGQEGNLADESQWRRRWRPVGPADAGGRLPLSEGFAPAVGGAWTVTGDGVPALILAADGEGVLPVAQENCYPGSAVGFYRVGPISLPAGTTELLRLRLMLADAEN